nr:hypothetical protein [Tanacetum cinerariifolium]
MNKEECEVGLKKLTWIFTKVARPHGHMTFLNPEDKIRVPIDTGRHVRSISFPSRSHPSTLQVEEELAYLKRNSSSLATVDTVCSSLAGLERLYISVNDLLTLPQIQQSLFHKKDEKLVDELLDRSMSLLDVCGSVKDAMEQVKDHIRNTQSALRRKKEGLNFNSSSLKKINEAKKTLSALKQVDNKIGSLALLDLDHHLSSVIRSLRDTSSLSVSILGSLLSLKSIFVSKPSSTKWPKSNLATSGIHGVVELALSDLGQLMMHEMCQLLIICERKQEKDKIETKPDKSKIKREAWKSLAKSKPVKDKKASNVKFINNEDAVYDDDSASEEEYDNPFGSSSASDSCHSSHQHRMVRRSRHDFDFKVDIPEFDGMKQPDEFLDWLHTVEKVFNFKEVSADQKVKLVAIKLRKHAGLWWENLKMRRVREGRKTIRTWEKVKKELKRRFLP